MSKALLSQLLRASLENAAVVADEEQGVVDATQTTVSNEGEAEAAAAEETAVEQPVLDEAATAEVQEAAAAAEEAPATEEGEMTAGEAVETAHPAVIASNEELSEDLAAAPAAEEAPAVVEASADAEAAEVQAPEAQETVEAPAAPEVVEGVEEAAAAAPMEASEAPAAAEEVAPAAEDVPSSTVAVSQEEGEAAPVEEMAAQVAEAEEAPVEGGDAPAPVIDENGETAVEVPGYEEDEGDLETSVYEIREEASEIDGAEDAISEMSDVADGLEAIAASMEASMKEGGLDPVAARMMHHALESYTTRVGYEQPVALGLESFGGRTSRREATTVSMEGVKEFLAKIWEAIKAVVARVKQLLIKFTKTVMVACGHLKLRTDKFEEQLKAGEGFKATKLTGGDTARDVVDSFRLQGVLDKIQLPGKYSWPALSKGMDDVLKAAEQTLAFELAVAEQIDRDFRAIKSAAGNANGPKLDVKAGIAAPAIFSVKGNSKVSTPVLPGGVVFSIDVADADWTKGRFTTYRITRESTDRSSNGYGMFWATLSSEQCEEVVEFCRKIIELRNQLSDEQEALDAQIKELDQLTFSDDLSDERKQEVKAAMSIFQKRASVQGQAAGKVMGYAVSMASALLRYAEVSAKIGVKQK